MKRETWLPSTPSSARRARTIVRAAGRDVDCEDVRLDDMVLATSEAVANAIEHGRRDSSIRVRVETSAAELWVEVCNRGRFSAPAGQPDRGGRRGRGLPMIAATVDRLEIRLGHERTRVRLTKRLATAP